MRQSVLETDANERPHQRRSPNTLTLGLLVNRLYLVFGEANRQARSTQFNLHFGVEANLFCHWFD